MRFIPILVLVLLPSMHAAPLEFSSGASFAGDDLAARGSWLIALYAPEDDADFHLNHEGNVSTDDMEQIRWRMTGPAGHKYNPPTAWSQGVKLSDRGIVDFRSRGEWSAIFVKAEEIRFTTTAPDGRMETTISQACLHDILRADEMNRSLLPHLCPQGSVMILSNPRVGDANHIVGFEARNTTALIVHNLEASCRGSNPCVDGGYRERTSVPLPLSSEAQLWRYGYDRLQMVDATFQGSGGTYAFFLGGDALDLAVNGSARFPLAVGSSCLNNQACSLSEDQTLRVWGNISIDDLVAANSVSNRLGASVSGTARFVMLDETRVRVPGIQATVAAFGLTALFLAAAKVLVGVFSTRTSQDALSHPNRKKLYNYILKNPGGTFREVVRGTGIPSGTARHHLAVLTQANLVQEHGHKATLRYFENHGRFDESWNTVVMLREPELKRLHEWLMVHPGSMQREVLDAASEAWGWSRSTTQHRLGRLASEGLIDVKLQGRLKLYTARSRAPVPTAEAKQSNTGVAVGSSRATTAAEQC